MRPLLSGLFSCQDHFGNSHVPPQRFTHDTPNTTVISGVKQFFVASTCVALLPAANEVARKECFRSCRSVHVGWRVGGPM